MAVKNNIKVGQKYVSKAFGDRVISPACRVIYVAGITDKFVTCLYENEDGNHIAWDQFIDRFCLYYDLVEEPNIISVQGIKIFDKYHAIDESGRITWERVKPC